MHFRFSSAKFEKWKTATRCSTCSLTTNPRHDFIFFAWIPFATGDGIQHVFTPLVMEMVRGIHICTFIWPKAWLGAETAFCSLPKNRCRFFSGFWSWQLEPANDQNISKWEAPQGPNYEVSEACPASSSVIRVCCCFCNFSSVLTSAFTVSHFAAPWAMCWKKHQFLWYFRTKCLSGF